MSSLSREEVAHLARLSRLALNEEELDHLGEQLVLTVAKPADGPKR